MTGTSDPAVVIVLTTLGADADARALARTLVEERLAACVNILPVMTSVYRWKDQVDEDREQQIVMKTSEPLLPRLEARLRELHSYELPELLVIRAAGGSGAYLEWVRTSTRSE